MHMKLDSSALRVLTPGGLIGQLKQNLPESSKKDVKKLSQTSQKLCPSGNGIARSTVRVTSFL